MRQVVLVDAAAPSICKPTGGYGLRGWSRADPSCLRRSRAPVPPMAVADQNDRRERRV